MLRCSIGATGKTTIINFNLLLWGFLQSFVLICLQKLIHAIVHCALEMPFGTGRMSVKNKESACITWPSCFTPSWWWCHDHCKAFLLPKLFSLTEINYFYGRWYPWNRSALGPNRTWKYVTILTRHARCLCSSAMLQPLLIHSLTYGVHKNGKNHKILLRY